MGDQDGDRQTRAFAGGLDSLGWEADVRGPEFGAPDFSLGAVNSRGGDTAAPQDHVWQADEAASPHDACAEEELRVRDADSPLMRSAAFSRGAEERDRQTYAIIGAAMEVHRELGPGFLESVYGDALALELPARSITFAREVPCPVHYKKQRLEGRFTADFLCHGRIILELKATRGLGDADTAQALNYLKATGLRRALVLNFGGASLQHRRLVLGESTPAEPPDLSV